MQCFMIWYFDIIWFFKRWIFFLKRYPGELAWQVDLTRKIVRSSEHLSRFHEFIIAATESVSQVFFYFSEDQNFPNLIKFRRFCHSQVAALNLWMSSLQRLVLLCCGAINSDIMICKTITLCAQSFEK